MKVKRSRPSDGVIINNLFTFITVVIISIVIVLYSTFVVDKIPKKDIPSKINEIPCQKENNTKIKIPNYQILKKSYNAIEKGYYKIEGSLIKKDQDSKIEEIVSVKELNTYIKSIIGIEQKKDFKNF